MYAEGVQSQAAQWAYGKKQYLIILQLLHSVQPTNLRNSLMQQGNLFQQPFDI